MYWRSTAVLNSLYSETWIITTALSPHTHTNCHTHRLSLLHEVAVKKKPSVYIPQCMLYLYHLPFISLHLPYLFLLFSLYSLHPSLPAPVSLTLPHSPLLLFHPLSSFLHLSLLPTSVTHPGDLPCAASMKISSTFGAIVTQRVSISSPSHFVGCKVCKLATMLRMSVLQSSKRSSRSKVRPPGNLFLHSASKSWGRGKVRVGMRGWREEGKRGIEKVTMTNSDLSQKILFVLCSPVGCLLPSALSLLC